MPEIIKSDRIPVDCKLYKILWWIGLLRNRNTFYQQDEELLNFITSQGSQ